MRVKFALGGCPGLGWISTNNVATFNLVDFICDNYFGPEEFFNDSSTAPPNHGYEPIKCISRLSTLAAILIFDKLVYDRRTTLFLSSIAIYSVAS